jgi:ABC-type multidrug transport system ATPase subunit
MSQDNHQKKYTLTPSNQQIIECMHIHNITENILHSRSYTKQHDKDDTYYNCPHIMNIQDLSCRLKINNKYKSLLKNINISICSNEMIALLAPSGAGKS